MSDETVCNSCGKSLKFKLGEVGAQTQDYGHCSFRKEYIPIGPVKNYCMECSLTSPQPQVFEI